MPNLVNIIYLKTLFYNIKKKETTKLYSLKNKNVRVSGNYIYFCMAPLGATGEGGDRKGLRCSQVRMYLTIGYLEFTLKGMRATSKYESICILKKKF